MFRAYDPGQDRLVAVKLFRLDLAPDRVHALVAEFERLVGADLTHAAIVAPIAAGIVQSAAYLAQDFVAADSLDTVVREHGPAPVGEGLRIVTEIAGGLDYAAVVGVAHGALHPRDVLISPDDVRITGLGVAHALERAGVQAPVRRPYTAPERAAGAVWDRRADVYTLAALAHELLWGRRPASSGAEAAAALDELPGADLRRLRDTFGRALADDPARRYPTALDFAESLRGCFAAADVGVLAADNRPAADEPRFAADADLRATADDLRPAAATLPFAAAADEPAADLDPPVDPGHDAAAPEAAETVRLEPQAPLPPPYDPHPARSAVWPLTLALVVGVALGFAGGYWLGQSERDRGQAASAADVATPETEVRLRADPTTGSADAARIASAAPPAAEPPAPPPAVPAAVEPGPAPPPAAEAKPAPAPAGRVTVRTTPAGARVQIDGRDVGRTPVTVPNLSRGGHTVRVTRDGYAAQERRVVVSAAQPSSTLNLRLARSTPPAPRPQAPPARGTADLLVESRPTGAAVFLNGKRIGTTPLSMPTVPVGSHAVRMELPGYKPWTAAIRVVAGEKNRVAASLEQ